MKQRYLLVLILLAVFSSACNKILDTKPNALLPANYFNSEEQLNNALNGIYDILGSQELYGSYFYSRLGTEADQGFYSRSDLLTGPQVYNFSPNDTYITSLWRILYTGIERANLLLANVDKPQMDENKRSIIRGEALFLRAYYYFLLTSNWGDVPLKLTPTTSGLSVGIAKTSSRDVYQQIINDMTEAEGLVKPITALGYGGRVNKSAVRGILARVCLNMAGYPLYDRAKYEDAMKWAEMVIKDTEAKHELNPSFQQVFINYARDVYDTKESIWEVEFWGNRVGNAFAETGSLGSFIGISTSNTDIGYSYAFINATERLYRLYESAINPLDNKEYSPDTRRDWNIAPFRYTGSNSDVESKWGSNQIYQRNAAKWRREYETLKPKSVAYTPQNFPILRYSDILLMYAEADNEFNFGPSPDAIGRVNLVRQRAYGAEAAIADLLPSQVSSYKAFLSAIQDERSRELCFEGLRKSDLIRWGIFINTMKLVGTEIDQSAVKYAAIAYKNVQTRHLLFPIPSYELALNNKLKQNPLW